LRRALVTAAAIVLALAAAAPATAFLPRGAVRFVTGPAVIVPIALPDPSEPAVIAPDAGGLPRLTAVEPDEGPGPPLAIDPALVETVFGFVVPRVGADGRSPLGHYARPTRLDCSRPCVAVLVTGLGLDEGLTQRALALPGPVGLSFSPYAAAAAWQARARADGHETLLGLPLEPAHVPRDDAGPLTIRAGDAEDVIDAAVQRVLAQGAGYVALDGEAGAFAADPATFAPLAALLRVRGLGLVEIDGSALAATAGSADLPYVGGASPIDPAPDAIDADLARVTETARAHGRAVAVLRPAPAGLDRVAAWIEGLPGQGIRLVPPSVLLAGGRAALAGGE
jgi:hypothetical protein